MRILPDNPNLDYLRREAKDLLVALRENDATAALADAQRSVAEQFGFHTWPELKAEVERRRDLPPPADPDLALNLADAFDLGKITAPMTPISYEFMGRRWRLQTEHGVWLAGPVFDWIGNDQSTLAAELRDRARDAGVVAPKPVRAADGELVKRIDGKNWRIDEWLDFGPKVLQPVRGSVARDVGRNLAAIHEVGMPTDQALTPGGPGHLTQRHSDEDWKKLIDRTSAAGMPWLDDLVRLREGTLRELEEIPSRPINEPFRICINDLNVDAVRMGANDELTLVHWEFAGPNQPEWELAYVLVHWAIYGVANPGTAAALVAGYRDRAGAAPELDLSSFWLSITANLNWTYDQFCTALGASDEERRRFSEAELRDLITDPYSVAKIEQVLAEL